MILLAAASSFNALAKTNTTTKISSSLNPSLYGQVVTFTAVVTPQPPNGELITFTEGSTVLGTAALSGGSAKFTTASLKAGGIDNMKASYPGDSTFNHSNSAGLSQTVNPASTTTSLTSSLNPINVGQNVTFSASVKPQYSGSVTGSVAFYNGASKLGTTALSGGVATYSTAALAAGTATITAEFKGSSSFTASNSIPVNQVVGTGTTTAPTLVYDGVTRYYQVFVPTVLPANPPLLLMLHGTYFDTPPYNPSTADWGWESVADQYGFILVQPASTYNPKTGQWNWNSYFMDSAFAPGEGGTCTEPPATGCPDDAGFLRQLITNLTSQYNVDPDRIFVTGFSSGAQMAERVGVELSDIVAAIAPTSGQLVGQEIPPPGLPGNAAAPIAVQEWHGTADTGLPPCNYGVTVYSGVKFTLDTVDDTFNYWVQQNDCANLQTKQPLCTDGSATPNLAGNLATDCKASNVEVQFIWEEGIGHSWRAQNNPARWLFLSAHPKPSSSKSLHY
jgi:poly(hydroxyalkanoate) depolymerase family esterase